MTFTADHIEFNILDGFFLVTFHNIEGHRTKTFSFAARNLAFVVVNYNSWTLHEVLKMQEITVHAQCCSRDLS